MYENGEYIKQKIILPLRPQRIALRTLLSVLVILSITALAIILLFIPVAGPFLAGLVIKAATVVGATITTGAIPFILSGLVAAFTTFTAAVINGVISFRIARANKKIDEENSNTLNNDTNVVPKSPLDPIRSNKATSLKTLFIKMNLPSRNVNSNWLAKYINELITDKNKTGKKIEVYLLLQTGGGVNLTHILWDKSGLIWENVDLRTKEDIKTKTVGMAMETAETLVKIFPAIEEESVVIIGEATPKEKTELNTLLDQLLEQQKNFKLSVKNEKIYLRNSIREETVNNQTLRTLFITTNLPKDNCIQELSKYIKELIIRENKTGNTEVYILRHREDNDGTWLNLTHCSWDKSDIIWRGVPLCTNMSEEMDTKIQETLVKIFPVPDEGYNYIMREATQAGKTELNQLLEHQKNVSLSVENQKINQNNPQDNQNSPTENTSLKNYN